MLDLGSSSGSERVTLMVGGRTGDAAITYCGLKATGALGMASLGDGWYGWRVGPIERVWTFVSISRIMALKYKNKNFKLEGNEHVLYWSQILQP